MNILLKSQAYESGVRPGDLITRVGKEPVRSAQDLVSRVAVLPPGAVVELGALLGVPTPANQAIYAVLKLHRMGRASEAPTLAPSA